MKLEWQRKMGRSSSYYTAETQQGRIRVSRVNRYGAPEFRVYFPDGMQTTRETIIEAQAAAEARAALTREAGNE